jgi:two-component system, NtrC family, response regulator HydG
MKKSQTMQTILIVDDEESNRLALRRVLQREGYAVIEAKDGQEALRIARRLPPAVMVTDLKMPKVGGLELLKRIRASNADIEVIVMTAYGSVETAVEAMKQGAWDFVSKPIKRADLIRAVRKAIQKHDLQRENRELRLELAQARPENWVGNSPSMRRILEEAEQVADSEASVLLVGESGTGKGLLARRIHGRSPRHSGKLVTLNCGAIPEALMESELFGHEKGAFTGAKERRKGRFELAQGGTLFLDEVTEMSPHLQVKLLRVLQDGEFERVGGSETIVSNARIIAATNRSPLQAIEEGILRADLYYRLNVIQLSLPPLRERPEDIPLLARHFVLETSRKNKRPPKELTKEAMECLALWRWPGNVRELENAIERAVVLSRKEQIELTDLPAMLRERTSDSDMLQFLPGTPLKEVERRLILATLGLVDGDKNKAANLLGITARTIYRKEAEWKEGK